jgi:hypothetical protein
MRPRFPKFSASFLLLFLLIFTQTLYAKTHSEALAVKAISESSAESAPAIAELRAMGPAGLNALFQKYADEINEQIANPLLAASPEWKRLSAALDAVSQQKDSYLSGLYWYTDIDEAKAAARASGKPILSLRLLGKLSEEFSCANSRFFRTVLYSNAQMSIMLRDRFILHWQTVRPVPKVTIDFGDGRKLERTLTGNSIHYILDAEGRPIDALPGLYGFWPFFRGLEHAEQIFKELQGKDDEARRLALTNYHRARIEAITAAWVADTGKTGGKIPDSLVMSGDTKSPRAIVVAPAAITKMVTERPLLGAIMTGTEALGKVTDEEGWKKIAALHADDAMLDSRSQALIRRQTENLFATLAAPRATDAQLASLIRNFQSLLALDSVRNEYVLHTKLHAWLMLGQNADDVNALNERVYAQLFLTPGSDPWLGLLSPDVYTALEGGGISRY